MGYDCCSSGVAGSSSYSGGSSGYSALESTVQQYQGASSSSIASYDSVSFSIAETRPESEFIPSAAKSILPYSMKQYAEGTYLQKTTQGNYTIPSKHFLNDNRPLTRFVGESLAIEEEIKEAFRKTTGKELPEDIIIRVCDKTELRAIHELNNGIWDEGIQGFAINRKKRGISEVFVGKGELAQVMLTLGHEIGHVLSESLPSQIDEEAKAFAFSMAWMKAIYKHNIAGLKTCINPNPANNGVHNKAFAFVASLIGKGRKAIEIYADLITRTISAEQI
jgi:hypothetical protein